MTNPDQESERTLLAQLAPELDEDLILRLVGAFHDLRKGYESGTLNYPYSLRGRSHLTYIQQVLMICRAHQPGEAYAGLPERLPRRRPAQCVRL